MKLFQIAGELASDTAERGKFTIVHAVTYDHTSRKAPKGREHVALA